MHMLRQITEKIVQAMKREDSSAAIFRVPGFGASCSSPEGLVCELIDKASSTLIGDLSLDLLQEVAVSGQLHELLETVTIAKAQRECNTSMKEEEKKSIFDETSHKNIATQKHGEADNVSTRLKLSENDSLIVGRTDFKLISELAQPKENHFLKNQKTISAFSFEQKGIGQEPATCQPMQEENGLSRKEDFFMKFIKLNIPKPSKQSDARSSKQSSKASSNLNVIKHMADKMADSQTYGRQHPSRRVLSNVISSKLVVKPQYSRQSSQQVPGSSWTTKPKKELSWMDEQPTGNEDYLMNFMNMGGSDYLCCPDSPNRESTQSGSRWIAANQKAIEMPSPAKGTQSVTKEVYTPTRKFTFESKTPEKVLPKVLFQNATNFSRDKSVLKVISKSKRSLGKESSAKISAVKFGRANNELSGVQRIKQWDCDIIAFGTPMKEDCKFYTCPENLKI